MKIIMYCQHVFGVGHLVRTLAIARELSKKNKVVVVSGGIPVDLTGYFDGLKIYWLEAVCSDENFKRYYSAARPEVPYEDICLSRLNNLKQIIKYEKPNVLWIEGFPFAKRKFKKEIFSAIEYTKKEFKSCTICSSVRDVLLKYGGDSDYNQYVADDLNNYFDILFVHSDPEKVKLDLTFAGIKNITIPVIYTGYVSRKLDNKKSLNWSDGAYAIASCGGSSICQELATVALRSQAKHFPERNIHVFLSLRQTIDNHFTGTGASEKIVIHDFSWNYIKYLSGAGVSISMGGYNSIVESIYCQVPSVIIPLPSNDEQRIRIEHLSDCNPFEIVEYCNLSEDLLFDAIMKVTKNNFVPEKININGAEFVSEYFEKL